MTELQPILDQSLAPYTSWNVGGPADRLYQPQTLAALIGILQSLPDDEPLLWMGRGSNLLVRDGGVRGSVILLREGVDQIDVLEGGAIRAESGVSLARLARQVRQLGSGHLGFLAGIPGSVGGALSMNAGAFGDEIWSWVDRVEVIDRSGALHHRDATAYQPGYRSIKRRGGQEQEEWFVAATFLLPNRQKQQDDLALRKQLKARNSSQPMGLPSCGSVFRNPEGDYAGRLIELSGLKGHCVGDACVAVEHANFIVNQGKATATEIEALIEEIEQVVQRDHGIQLQREVRVVGERLRTDDES